MAFFHRKYSRGSQLIIFFFGFISISWLLSTLYFGFLNTECNCNCNPQTTKLKHLSSRSSSQHKLAVVIPLRDRFEELQDIVLNLTNFLNRQNIDNHIFAINQVDKLRFNRGALLNIGYLETPVSYDYIALHDVDLLPVNEKLLYSFPSAGPHHVAAPHLHPRYHYPTFIGGVMLITRNHYKKVNGLSNRYWGWGLEDDEFYARLKEAQLPISRPANLSTGFSSFLHIHDRRRRSRDQVRCYDQHLVTRQRDRLTGLANVQYNLLSRRQLSVNNIDFTVLNVELQCDLSSTPWCDCTQSGNNSPSEKRGEILKRIPPGEHIAPKLNFKKHVNPDG